MNKRHLLKLGLASLPALALFLHPVVADESIHFSSCKEAWENGYADIHRGEPGYSATLDKDHDGIACLVVHLDIVRIQVAGTQRDFFRGHQEIDPVKTGFRKGAHVGSEKHHHQGLVRLQLPETNGQDASQDQPNDRQYQWPTCQIRIRTTDQTPYTEDSQC